MSERLGELAALGTALLWALTYVQFTIAVRRIGPGRLNRLRLLAALVFLAVVHGVLYRTPVPLDAGAGRWGWLILSGVIGFAISDALLFTAMLHLGAHRTSLMMALVPVVSALLAWGLFGEVLTWIQMLAGLVTVGGVALVISATRTADSPSTDDAPSADGAPSAGAASPTDGGARRVLVGVLFAGGAAVAQSLRYILSKQGMSGGFPVVSANVMQILSATVAVWIVALVRRDVRGSFRAMIERRALRPTVGGALTGPFLGVTLSLVALSSAPVGIASTLMALAPVALLPLSWFLFRERITLRAIAGTVLAVGGVALLFLS